MLVKGCSPLFLTGRSKQPRPDGIFDDLVNCYLYVSGCTPLPVRSDYLTGPTRPGQCRLLLSWCRQ
jgi:hypothetical protein